VKAKMSVVRKRTRERFFQEFGGESNVDFENIGNEVLLKASAWYQITYHRSLDNPETLLSFPWVIADVLALVKSDKRQKRTKNTAKEVIEEDEFEDTLFDIGSSIVRRFFFTKRQRQFTLDNLKYVANMVLGILTPVEGVSFIPVGTPVLGLMKTDEVTLDIYVDTKQNRKAVFDLIQHVLSTKRIVIVERGPYPRYRVNLVDNVYFVRFSTDVNVLRRSIFLKTFIEENKEIVPAILFLLDWGRRSFISSPTRSRSIFDEITFAMVVCRSVLTLRNVPTEMVSHQKNIGMDGISVETMHTIDVDDFPSSKTKTLANIVLHFFKDYRAVLSENIKKEQIHFIPDPSHRKDDKNLLKHPLSQNNTTSLLNEMLCGYQQVAEKNSIDSFFRDVQFDESHLVLNLPLDTWDSLLFAEAYIERQLSKATGADIKIRRTNFRETKGIILEAWGSSEELWNVNKSLQDLGEKSSKFISTFARNKTFIEGAYVTLFEGSRSQNDILDFRNYTGQIQEHHKHRGPACLPFLLGVIRNVDPSLEHVDDNDLDCWEFQRVFLEQVYIVRENHDATYHGVLRFAMTFGKVYFVNVDASQMTIKALQENLHRKHFIERKDFPIHQRERVRGRGRGRQRGESYTTLQNNFPSRRKKGSSSFIPCNCDPIKVEKFLEEMGFKKDGKEKKYHVSLQTGEADFGKPHTGLCVLDRDFRFIQFLLSDLKWFAGDIIRLKNDVNKDTLDVRCKLQSRRILEVESVRQMSDIQGLLEHDFRLVENGGNGLRVSSNFKDRVTLIREKQVNSYSYPDLSDEQSVWHNMKIEVATVKEHCGYNSIIGTFSDIVEKTEVTMIPKLPDLSLSDEELKTYARKTWNLALYLGHRFE
jgi:RNA-dependent RNA polymerase